MFGHPVFSHKPDRQCSESRCTRAWTCAKENREGWERGEGMGWGEAVGGSYEWGGLG